jgi:hypothetical protein
MRLTKLDYTFAADGATVATGSALERDDPAKTAVVVEVRSARLGRADDDAGAHRGVDQIVRVPVTAQIHPH